MNKATEHITIGNMARINSISEQTLRLYDKMKLLQPSEINNETGYRYYNIKQCAQLDMIQYMKALGMNLIQIKKCFEEKDIEKLREILELQKQNIEKQIVAEIVREKALKSLEDEIPHGIAVETESIKEREGSDILDITVIIYCEKDSHKGIVIGKKGAMLKLIGTRAREDMEHFFGCKVNLQCWVKVRGLEK